MISPERADEAKDTVGAVAWDRNGDLAAGTSTGGIDHLKAMLAVLPKAVPVYAVGGVGAANMADWKKGGAAGFGLGSELFKPDFSDAEIAERARKCVAAFRAT